MFHIYERDLDPQFRLYHDSILTNPSSPPHVNYYAEAMVCLEGTLSMKVNQKERILHQGEGTLIHSLEVHEFSPEPKSKIFLVCFSPALFSDLFHPAKDCPSPVKKLSEESIRYLSHLTERGLSYPENKQEIQMVLRILLYEIPCILPEQEQTMAVCRGVSYLEQHYAENVTLEQLSRAIGINRVYASQMFPKYLNGTTFTQVLNYIRLNRAIRLLKTMTIAQAALESGFGSVRQFNRVFKSVTGKTPREYHDTEQNQTYRRII